MRKEYTYHNKEEKQEIVKRYLSGESPEKLGKELGVSDGNIRKKRLLEKAKCTGYPILLHSDQGNQYQALLREYNAIQSMSRAGTPRDNAVMESFFGRFKDVLRFQFRYSEHDNLTAVISDAVSYFNSVRPIRKRNGKPPIQFRIEQAA